MNLINIGDNKYMNILITGAKGFIGKNLVSVLKTMKDYTLFEYDIDCEYELFEKYTKECNFVIHLAGVNRPQNELEFIDGNVDFTEKLLVKLQKNHNKSPIVMSSSIQVLVDNPYGKSKKAAEDLLIHYSKNYSVPVYIYRLPNVFGKWCRANYNSVVATFCYNIANDINITVNDSNAVVTLTYIDDVVQNFIDNIVNGKVAQNNRYCEVFPTYKTTVGEIAKLIYSFKESRTTREVADLSDEFVKKLYATYLSYLPQNKFCYPLKMNIDDRGAFTEFIRTPDRGQISVNISKPGIIKGNHWHQTKNEKFLVVKGNGVVKFRQIGTYEVIEYHVSGDKFEVVDIPVGYTHNIQNMGNDEMITIIWASEEFDPEKPDTIYEEV